MNPRVRLAILILLLACSSCALLAQSNVQPGQVAVPVVSSSQSNENSGLVPIQLLPNGIASTSNSRPIAEIDDKSDQRLKTIWKISMAAMLGATALDAASSMGKQENNPLLQSSDGTFGAKGIAVKSTLAAICIAPQILLRNHRELRKPLIILNFIDAGIFASVAVHNFGVSQPSHP